MGKFGTLGTPTLSIIVGNGWRLRAASRIANVGRQAVCNSPPDSYENLLIAFF